MADIVLKDLCKSYEGNQVLDHFSATFQHGMVSCIMSPSGSGKTTLLRILMGLESSDSGTISGLNKNTLRVVFQNDRLCEHLSPVANIRLPSPEHSIEVVCEALNSVGLIGCEQQLLSSLSGGMRRRVAILRAVLSQYEVLLLDEPFKGLDIETKKIVIAYTKQMTAHKTVLLVTHDSIEAQLLGATAVVHL